MTHKRWLLVFITGLFFCSCFKLFPLDPEKSVTQLLIDNWTDDTGLPQNFVRTILQTRDGYLWIGTEEGLARFDGVKFKIFNDRNTPALTCNNIFCLLEDSRKNLWIGSQGGGLVMLRTDTGLFKKYGENEGLTSEYIYCIVEDREKNFWIGTDGGGLFRFDGARFTPYTTKNGLPNNNIRTLFLDHNQDLWVGTAQGLACLKNNSFIKFSVNDGLPDTTFLSIFEDSSGVLWIGSDMGLYRMEQGKFIQPAENLKSSSIFSLFEDTDKNLWIGSSSEGLTRYSGGKFSSLTKNDGLADNYILYITEDREKNLWVGTAYGGLHRLKDRIITLFTTKEGLSENITFINYEDSKGYLWFGTNNGLTRYKDGKFICVTTKNGLSNNVIDAIVEDRSGYIWVGTDDGLIQLQNFPDKILNVSENLRKHMILAVNEDKDGVIWAGTDKGIRKVSKDIASPEKISENKILGSKVINFIFKERNGNLWISTYRSGITKYSDGRFTAFTKKDGLSSDRMYFVYEDDESVLWMGSDNGISRFKNGIFTRFSKKDGLFTDNIFQILEDNQGNFWMSSNKGIFRVRKKDLNDMADGKLKRVEYVLFDKEMGMPTNECNGGFQDAGCRSHDGKLWFPTINGVVGIDPGNIKSNAILPPVLIEHVLLDGVSTNFKPGLQFPQKVKRLEIVYTATSFSNPKKVKFKYKLEGYDENWIDAGTLRSAAYTNLDGGSYRFNVIACNNDGLWNQKGAVIAFTVIPHFWKTWWFMLISLFIFAFLSYAVIAFFRKYIALASFWKRQKYVGKFKLLDKIGSGGMGTVYKAKNLIDKSETVAIKVLREDMFEDEKNIKRFKQEAAIIDQLDHPNIVKVVERGQSKNNLFIAMELLEGQTLSQKIKEQRKLDLKEAVHIMFQVSDALAKIHSKNIIHRDMKPDNIMLINKNGDPNFVKILDFGLARTQFQTRLTQTGVVIGTICYMSPEQISGKGAYDSSDVYALAIIFYEMLTGEKPFLGETTIDTMQKILEGNPVEPTKFRSDISDDLNDLILRMLNKDKDLRPTIGKVMETLRVIYCNILESGYTS